MVPWVVAMAFGFVGGILLHSLYRRRKDKRIAAQRVVEAPNSAHVSQLVRQRERRERWSRIALAALHPLNREEVEHLLAIVRDGGEKALSERERTFLDTLSEGR